MKVTRKLNGLWFAPIKSWYAVSSIENYFQNSGRYWLGNKFFKWTLYVFLLFKLSRHHADCGTQMEHKARMMIFSDQHSNSAGVLNQVPRGTYKIWIGVIKTFSSWVILKCCNTWLYGGIVTTFNILTRKIVSFIDNSWIKYVSFLVWEQNPLAALQPEFRLKVGNKPCRPFKSASQPQMGLEKVLRYREVARESIVIACCTTTRLQQEL
jgi:hypothetical protein